MVKIIKSSYSDEKKDGTKLITKDGRPYYKVGIQVNEHGERWINGLVFNLTPQEIKAWEGQEVDLTIKEEEYMGNALNS